VLLISCLVVNEAEMEKKEHSPDLHTAKSPLQREYFVIRFLVFTFGETKVMVMWFLPKQDGCSVSPE